MNSKILQPLQKIGQFWTKYLFAGSILILGLSAAGKAITYSKLFPSLAPTAKDLGLSRDLVFLAVAVEILVMGILSAPRISRGIKAQCLMVLCFAFIGFRVAGNPGKVGCGCFANPDVLSAQVAAGLEVFGYASLAYMTIGSLWIYLQTQKARSLAASGLSSPSTPHEEPVQTPAQS